MAAHLAMCFGEEKHWRLVKQATFVHTTSFLFRSNENDDNPSLGRNLGRVGSAIYSRSSTAQQPWNAAIRPPLDCRNASKVV
jgi:hypothetical protein